MDKIIPDIAPKVNHWPGAKTVLNRRFSAVVAAAQAARKMKSEQRSRVTLTPCPSTETVASKTGSESSKRGSDGSKIRDSLFSFQSGKWKKKPGKFGKPFLVTRSVDTRPDFIKLVSRNLVISKFLYQALYECGHQL